MKNFYKSSFFNTVFNSGGAAGVTVYFDTQDGEVIEPKTYSIGKPYGTLPTPIKEGYNFIGWYDMQDGGNLITEDTRANASVLTLYARWEIKQYTVRFLDWDNSELKTEKVNHGSAATAPENPTRIGYTFSNWDKEFTNIIRDIDIQAIYTINSYTLTFDANGGNVEPQSKKIKYNEKYGQLPTPNKENKNFIGWFTELDAGTEVDENTLMIAGNVTIYAYWADIQGAVNFTLKSNTGTQLGTLQKQGIVGNTENVEFEEKNGYTKPNNREITYTIKEQNLEVIYNIINYTITYNLDEGVADNPSEYTVETDNITLNNPAKEGFNFAGWTGTGLSEPTLSVIINKGSYGNREYTATYNAIDTIIITEDNKKTLTEDEQKVIIIE